MKKKVAIVYQSLSGNTEKLANSIAEALNDIQYIGAPDIAPKDCDLYFVGFWTDKGTCSPSISSFLGEINDADVFLFGTAGFGGDNSYFQQILSRVSTSVSPSCNIIGTFMCQGKMPESVRVGYEKMLETNPEMGRKMLENFDRALNHPNESDLAMLKSLIKEV